VNSSIGTNWDHWKASPPHRQHRKHQFTPPSHRTRHPSNASIKKFHSNLLTQLLGLLHGWMVMQVIFERRAIEPRKPLPPRQTAQNTAYPHKIKLCKCAQGRHTMSAKTQEQTTGKAGRGREEEGAAKNSANQPRTNAQFAQHH
jgi:hypothetical protein